MVQSVTETSQIIKFITIIGDYIIINASFIILYLLFPGDNYPNSQQMIQCLTLLSICYIPCISIFKVQLHKRIVNPEQIIGRVLMSVTTFIVLFICVLGLMRTGIPNLFLFSYYIIVLFGIVSWRIGMRFFVKRVRRHGQNSNIAIMIGSKNNVVELYHKISDDASYGYRVNGVFDDEPIKNFPENVRYLGSVSEVIPYLEKNPVKEVFCCLPSNRENDILPIINFCENHMIHFYSVPNVRNYLRRKMKLELFDDIPVLYIRDEPLQKLENKLLKRAFDFSVSSLFLCTVYPFIYAIVGSIIKITSPGPVYFKQERSGQEGCVFKCIKFRSMKVNAECDTLQATEHDPRKTKFGDFIRRTNIDELPQFINVWKGEMSIIGPRPHMLKHTEEYSRIINKYMVRHLAKPGITGWAQVTGYRGETKELYQMEGRVKKDIWYIENWSFLLDLRIIYKTVVNIIHGDKHAY